MITGSVIANSPLLYGMIAIGLAIIIVYAVMSVSKATKKCKEAGITSDTIKSVVKGTILSSIVPSLAILLGFVTLSVSLGAAWPWWRLSVIGALSYETMAATYTADGIGVALADILSSDATVFGAVMIVMSIGVCTGPIMVALFAKKYSMGVMKAKNSKSEWGEIMSGCFFMTMFAVYLPIMLLTDLPTTLTMVVSLGVSIICGIFAKKHKWLNDFIMAIAMIVAMASSVLWVQLFK